MRFAERIHATHRFWRYRLKHNRHEMRLLREHVRPGDTVLDVGAHKGAYTYWLSRAVGPKGQVIAFEPQPDLAAYIEDVARTFRLKNTTIANCALSSTNGEGVLRQPDDHPQGGATLEELGRPNKQISVSKHRMDDYVRSIDHRPIRFIKCDVQDHELSVFQGGEQTLREDRPYILFECLQQCWEELSDYLVGLGYVGTHAVVKRTLFDFDDDAWKDDFGEYLGNFLFAHKDALNSATAVAA